MTFATDANGLYLAALRAQQNGRYQDALVLLGQASDAGHVLAMSLLGAQLLFGRGAPLEPIQGLTLVFRAADLGGGYACALAAVICAFGAAGPVDWPRALDYLERGAAAGHAGAQAQLALLADPSGRPGPRGRNWGNLRRAVSIDSWRRAPELKPVMDDPDIRTAAHFTSQAVCSWVIDHAKDRLEAAPVFATGAMEKAKSSGRTNTYAGFELNSADLVVLALRERMAAAAGLDIKGFEPCQALNYSPGETFERHFDFMDPDVPGERQSLKERGQRTHTLLIYLNQGYEGGETDFPAIGYRHKGRRGEMLVFRNVDATGAPDRRMIHAGLAPTRGEKWVLSQWARPPRIAATG